MLETFRYARKPFFVDAVQVTAENISEVAKWCNGDVRTDNTGAKYVKVRVHMPKNPRQTQAFVGDWVLFAGTGYKVYTPKAFVGSFERAADEDVVFQSPDPIVTEAAEAPKKEKKSA